MERIQEKPSIRNQLFAVLTVNIITFNQGNVIGWVSPTLPILMSKDSPTGEPFTQTLISLVASIFCIGAMVGTITYGWLSDRIGRKKSALSSAIPFVICWSTKLLWPTPFTIIFSRLIAGFGAGGMLVVAPIYSSELASVEYRGLLGSLVTLTFNFGIVFMYIIGDLLSYNTVLIIMICLPTIFLFLMVKLPESPQHLVKCGSYKEAAEAVGWFRCLPADSVSVQNEVDRIKYEILSSQDSNKGEAGISSIRFLLNSPPSLKTLAVTSSLLGLQSLMGMFAVLSYASEIFRNAGNTLSPGLSSILIGLLQLCGSFVATSFIERLGRKVLLIGSALIVSISMATLGSYFYAANNQYDLSSYGLIPVISLSVVVCTFAMGIGPIPFILPSEMFLMQVRGLAMSICLISMWTSSFLVSQFYSPLADYFGSHFVFWGFSLIGILAITLVILFLPETKGVPLGDIVYYFGGNKNLAKDINNDETEIPLKRIVRNDNTYEDGVY